MHVGERTETLPSISVKEQKWFRLYLGTTGNRAFYIWKRSEIILAVSISTWNPTVHIWKWPEILPSISGNDQKSYRPYLEMTRNSTVNIREWPEILPSGKRRCSLLQRPEIVPSIWVNDLNCYCLYTVKWDQNNFHLYPVFQSTSPSICGNDR